MKTIKITILLFLFSICAAPVFSQQKTTQEMNDKMGKALDELTPEQLSLVLQHATSLVDQKDNKKAIARVMELLPPKQKQELLNFTVMEKYGLNDPKPVKAKPAKPLAQHRPVAPPHDHSAHEKTAAPAAPVGPTTTVEFAEKEFDFGVIEQGEKISHVYKFTNTGTEPLIIKNAKGSCGCTVPQWPKAPLAPGETAEMLVEFNSKGKMGKQNKRVTITANTNPPQTFINIKGEIVKQEKAN